MVLCSLSHPTDEDICYLDHWTLLSSY